MGLRINTNLPALTAMRSMDINMRNTQRAMKQLATGSKYADGTEPGAADYAIGEKIRAQEKGMEAAANNAATATNFVQIAEGGLNEQNNILMRMRELSVQSASDTYSDDEREMMNYEFQQLSKEFDRVAQSTTYGSQKLLNGDGKTYQFQVGPSNSSNDVIKYDYEINSTASNLNVDGLDVSSNSNAQDSLSKIDDAITQIGKQRASLGAIQSRFNSVSNYTADQIIGLEEGRSRIEDTDVAKSYSDFVKGQALQQYQIAVLSEANRLPGNILKLIA